MSVAINVKDGLQRAYPGTEGQKSIPRSLPGAIVFPTPKRKRPFATELAQARYGRVKQSLYIHDSETGKQNTDDHIFQERWERVYFFVEVKNTCVEIFDLFWLIYILLALSSGIGVGGPVSGGKTVLSIRSQWKDNQFLSQRLVVHRKSTVSKCIQSQHGTWHASKELWRWLSIWEFWAVRMKGRKKRDLAFFCRFLHPISLEATQFLEVSGWEIIGPSHCVVTQILRRMGNRKNVKEN